MYLVEWKKVSLECSQRYQQVRTRLSSSNPEPVIRTVVPSGPEFGVNVSVGPSTWNGAVAISPPGLPVT